jgi:hypothetical protein
MAGACCRPSRSTCRSASVSNQGLQGQSLWWPVREGAERTALSVTHGLPAAERFVDLLDASW